MQNQNPALDVSVDKATVSTELLSDNMVTATLKGSGGFSGAVTLTASVVDATGAALTGWTVTLDKPSVTLAANGTETVVATVKVPSQTSSMTGTVKIEATSSLGAKSAMSTVTAANQLSLPMVTEGATCAQLTTNKALTIAVGTKVIWKNMDAAKRITIHVNNGGTDFIHEPDPGMAPMNGTFEQMSAKTGTLTWYCHAPGNDPGRYTITVK